MVWLEVLGSDGVLVRSLQPNWNHPPLLYFTEAEGHARWRVFHKRLRALDKAAGQVKDQLHAELGAVFADANRALFELQRGALFCLRKKASAEFVVTDTGGFAVSGKLANACHPQLEREDVGACAHRMRRGRHTSPSCLTARAG